MKEDEYTSVEMDLMQSMASAIVHGKDFIKPAEVLDQAHKIAGKAGIPAERVRHIYNKILEAIK